MKDEYDSSKAQQGKFHHADATLNLPVYLDDGNRQAIEKLAAQKRVDVATVVNELLRTDQRVIRSA